MYFLDWFGCEKETALCPRFNLATRTTIYLKSIAYGPHHKEQQIVTVDGSGNLRVVHTEPSDCYLGMYGQSFPDRCWSMDGKFVVFSSPFKSSIQSYALNLSILTKLLLCHAILVYTNVFFYRYPPNLHTASPCRLHGKCYP